MNSLEHQQGKRCGTIQISQSLKPTGTDYANLDHKVRDMAQSEHKLTKKRPELTPNDEISGVVMAIRYSCAKVSFMHLYNRTIGKIFPQ